MANGNNKGLREIMRDMVVARTSLVYLLSDEDRRVEMEIRSLGSAFKPPFRTYVWSCTTGVTHGDEVVVANPSLMQALDWFMKIQETAFLILNDIHIFIRDNPPIIRKLKDTAKIIDNGYKRIFMIAPVLEIPLELQSELALIDVPEENIPPHYRGKVVSGMNVEVIMPLFERTALDYFIEPLRNRMRTAFRER